MTHVEKHLNPLATYFGYEINPKWTFMDVMWQLQRWMESYPNLVEYAIAICWGIWKDRNTARHGGKCREGKAIVRAC